MNYYYDLPIDIIKHIESYLKIKPNEIINFINNPPKNIKKMLRHLIPNTDYNRKEYRMTRERLDEYNNEIEEVNKNFIKFCIEFEIKSKKPLGCRKAIKYGFISSMREGFLLQRIMSSADHVKEYITYDKKNIIISSPYDNDEGYCSNKEHLKYNFKRYSRKLYRYDCITYILVLE